ALLRYQFAINSGATVQLQTDWNYRGDYYVNADNQNNPYIPGRTIGNVRVTYRPLGGRWDFSFWGLNVSDKHYPTGGYRLAVAESDILYFGDPLTYGVSVHVRF